MDSPHSGPPGRIPREVRSEGEPSELGGTGFERLALDLEARFEAGVGSPWSDADFERLAFEAFRVQFGGCAPYRALCERRGVAPGNVASWHDVPLVPTTAFKHFDLVSTPGAPTDAVFRTSGTTRGAGARGRHRVPCLDLYRASLLDPFRAALLPDLEFAEFLSLIPSPEDLPDSSLSFMVGSAAERLATTIHWLVDAEGSFREPEGGAGSAADPARAARGDGPVVLLGTALAFVHLLEQGRTRLGRLPEGSRVMETGGFKGARRTVSRSGLHRAISDETGVPASRIVNEYGMTELLSQLYEPVLTEGAGAAGLHVPPPWLRVRALDPLSLEPLGEGEEGVLAFFDLANLGSVSHVLTEDVGSITGGRVRLRGRAAGAEPRGCSVAMDELMSAARGG